MAPDLSRLGKWTGTGKSRDFRIPGGPKLENKLKTTVGFAL